MNGECNQNKRDPIIVAESQRIIENSETSAFDFSERLANGFMGQFNQKHIFIETQ